MQETEYERNQPISVRLKRCLIETVSPELELHVHDDLDFLFENTNIPLVFKQNAEVYIMQESRIVLVGTIERAMYFIVNNRGKIMKNCFPHVV